MKSHKALFCNLTCPLVVFGSITFQTSVSKFSFLYFIQKCFWYELHLYFLIFLHQDGGSIFSDYKEHPSQIIKLVPLFSKDVEIFKKTNSRCKGGNQVHSYAFSHMFSKSRVSTTAFWVNLHRKLV